MALPTFPTSESDFLAALNSDPYDASSNPYGLGAGGHRQLFPESMDDIAIVAHFVNNMGISVNDLATQVALDAAAAAVGSGTEATAAAIRIGTAAFYMSIRRAYEASQSVGLTDAATIALDLSTGINFKVTLAGNRTLANPTNKISGKSGMIKVVQDATANRTLAFGSDYLLIGGIPAWPAVAAARTILTYFIEDDGKVLISFGGSTA